MRTFGKKLLVFTTQLAFVIHASAAGVFLTPHQLSARTEEGLRVIDVPNVSVAVATQPSVMPDRTLQYAITWSVGDGTVTDATITNPLPDNTSYVSADCGVPADAACTASYGDGVATWNLGTRTAGSSGTVALSVQTSNDTSRIKSSVVLTSTATFETNETEPVSNAATTLVSDHGTLSVMLVVPDGQWPASAWDVHVQRHGQTAEEPLRPDGLGATFSFVAPDTYAVFTTVHPNNGAKPDGYTASSRNCPNGVTTVAKDAPSFCTLTMTKTQTQLSVQKDMDDDGDGLADRKNIADWYYAVTDDTGQGLNLSHQQMGERRLLTMPGTYTVTEEQQAGYATVSWSCADTVNNATIISGTGSVAIVPLLNATSVACTFLGTKTAAPPATSTVTVRKNVDTNGDGTVDQTNASGWTWNVDGVQQGIAAGTSITLNTGTYTISENQQNGFRVTDLTCNGVSYGALTSQSLTLTVDGLDCTFTNGAIIAPQPPTPAITLQKSGPATVNAGENIAYTLTWSVSGADVTNAVISDSVPANTTFVSMDCGTTTGTCTAANTDGTTSWNLGSRAAGATGIVTLTVKASSVIANGTVVTNTGTFDTEETAPVTATTSATVQSASTLSLTATSSPDPVAPGGTLTYTLNWTVTGTASLTGLTLTDTLPADVRFVSASTGGTHSGSATGGTVTWQFGNATPGDTGSVAITATVAATLQNAATLTNTASLSAQGAPSVTAAQTTKVQMTTVTVTAAPALSIKKSVDLIFANPGDIASYTVIVTNGGNEAATNVTITDTLPSPFTFVDGGANVKTFTVGTLSPGNSSTLQYNVLVGEQAAAGTYTNTAEAKAGNASPVSATANLDVRIPTVAAAALAPTPTLTITKTIRKLSATPGTTLRYTLKVTNMGEGDALDVRVSDMLPDDFGYADTGSQKRIWTLGTVFADETRTIAYDVTIAGTATAGTKTNIAVLTAKNHPSRSASASIEVHTPQVLGAQLPATGVTSANIQIVFLTGITCLLAGFAGLLLLRRKKEAIEPCRPNLLTGLAIS